MISTTDAEVDAVGDSLDYMYLFESSSASDSDASIHRPSHKHFSVLAGMWPRRLALWKIKCF